MHEGVVNESVIFGVGEEIVEMWATLVDCVEGIGIRTSRGRLFTWGGNQGKSVVFNLPRDKRICAFMGKTGSHLMCFSAYYL